MAKTESQAEGVAKCTEIEIESGIGRSRSIWNIWNRAESHINNECAHIHKQAYKHTLAEKTAY